MRSLACRSYTSLPLASVAQDAPPPDPDIDEESAQSPRLVMHSRSVRGRQIVSCVVGGCLCLAVVAGVPHSSFRAWFATVDVSHNSVQLSAADNRASADKRSDAHADDHRWEGLHVLTQKMYPSSPENAPASRVDRKRNPAMTPNFLAYGRDAPANTPKWEGLRALMQKMYSSDLVNLTTSTRTTSTTLAARVAPAPSVDSHKSHLLSWLGSRKFHKRSNITFEPVEEPRSSRPSAARATTSTSATKTSTSTSATRTTTSSTSSSATRTSTSTQPVTTTTEGTEEQKRCGKVVHDVDFQVGDDLNVIHDVKSGEACCDKCKAEHGCKSWVLGFWGGCGELPCVCYLKRAKPKEFQKVPYKGLLAGVLPDLDTSKQRESGVQQDSSGNDVNHGYLASDLDKYFDETSKVQKSKTPAGPTLFCYMVIMPKGYEPKLVKAQLEIQAGVFSCDEFAIYSQSHDPVHIGSMASQTVVTVPIPGSPAWLAPVPNTADDVWHNTNVFSRAWQKIGKAETFKKYDYTVKADPDAVFVPARLRDRLQERDFDASSESVFFLNCAQWGSLQGPLEVMSNAAAKAFHSKDGQDRCFNELPWKDWGEDWFVNNCLLKLGARAVEGYDLLDDKWCTHNAPKCWDDRKAAFHPFKTLDAWMKCAEEADGSDMITFRK